MVFIVSILTANLVTTWIDDYVITYKDTYKPYIFTWIGMAIVIIVYYPLFSRIDKWSTVLADKFIRFGKKYTGEKTGAFFAFVFLLLLLYYFYGKLWFESNVFSNFFHSIFK